MSTIDRYKKKGGFLQLLTLIETTTGEKHDKFLKMVADENPLWEQELQKRMLTLEKVCSWPVNYLMEIIPHLPPANLAAILTLLSAEKQALFMSALGHSEKRKLEAAMQERKPTHGEAITSWMKLLTEIRTMVQTGHLKFEKFAPDLVIPDNVEEILGNQKSHVTERELEAVAPAPPASAPPQLAEEMNFLRRKLLQVNQENQKLQNENQVLKTKLDQIRKIA